MGCEVAVISQVFPMICLAPAQHSLTDTQQSAVNGIVSNIANHVGPSVLCGYAGTGKTVTTAALVSRLVSEGLKVVVATPTHKARSQVERALIARSASKFEVVTVHRLLGLKQVINYHTGEVSFESDPKGNNMLTIKEKWDEEAKEMVPLRPIEVVIVDETSMLQSSLYAQLVQETQDRHLVFVGDERQLLPVGEASVCPAFTESPSIYRLTEVLRHDGAILNLATSTRSMGSGRARFESADGGETRVIAYDRPSDWLFALLEIAKKEEVMIDPDYFRVLAFSNQAVEEMNERIHQHIYGFNAPEYALGMVCVTCDAVADPLGGRTLLHSTVDLRIENAQIEPWKPGGLIVRKDRYGIPIYKQFNLDEYDYLQKDPKHKKLLDDLEEFLESEKEYKAWELEIEVVGDSEVQQVEHIKVIAKGDQQRWIQSQKSIALFAKSADDKDLRRDLWKLYFCRKDQIARIQPASALTVHKSQGSTFTHVFLHPSIDDRKDMQNQLAYVGITRAAQTLHVIADR
jgi:exodeoxyribonuclease V